MTIGRVIDVSSNNHPSGAPINWSAVRAAGVTTALIKATEGTGYVNPFFHQDVAGALGQGLDVLAYHFARFGNPTAEVAHFKSIAGTLAAILDVEMSENVPWMRTFLMQLGRPAGQCMAYGSASSFRDVYQRIPALPWVAAYGQPYPGWGVLWQFTSSASIAGVVGPCDENRWYGSELQYEILFDKTAPTPPAGRTEMLAPTPSGKGYWRVNPLGAVITYGDANYLGGPNTSNTAAPGQPPKWTGKPDLVAGRSVVSIVAHPLEQGYWIEDNYGNVYAYGAAPYLSPNA